MSVTDQQVMDSVWYAQPDDTIGGWCVMLEDAPPSQGGIEAGGFLSEAVARHVADLHNSFIARNGG